MTRRSLALLALLGAALAACGHYGAPVRATADPAQQEEPHEDE